MMDSVAVDANKQMTTPQVVLLHKKATLICNLKIFSIKKFKTVCIACTWSFKQKQNKVWKQTNFH